MEFWRLPTVMEKVGLSKSEIYRRVQDGAFPKPRRFPGTQKSFWISGEVRQWQFDILREALAA